MLYIIYYTVRRHDGAISGLQQTDVNVTLKNNYHFSLSYKYKIIRYNTYNIIFPSLVI